MNAKNQLRTLASLAALLVISACGGDEDTPEDVDCSGTIPTYADVTALQKCATCHSSQKTGADRRSAPPSVNFDTEAAANMHAQAAATEVNEGAMPPSGSGVTLTADEKQALYKWAECR